MKEIFNIIGKIITIITIIIVGLMVLLTFSIHWILKTWANLSMEELVYHLQVPLEGTNESMVTEYIKVCLIPAIIALLLVITGMFFLRKRKKAFRIFVCSCLGISFCMGGVMLYRAWDKLEIGDYIANQMEDSVFIELLYADPDKVKLDFPEKKRNLIYIYLESMETTYADKKNGGAFDENAIPELTELSMENENFSGSDNILNGGYSLTGSTWTMGAMFAQTSGLPLNISIDGNDMDTQDSFFSGIVTLGDILEKEGYSQTLMLGSEAVFGGRELYFTDHGHYDILDYNYAIENGWIPEDYRVWWGFEDEKLFSFAKEKLIDLAAQEEPFNLTLLTVDTHFEDGYVCELCDDKFGDNQYANVMACSSKQVSEFVKWIQQQDFYENTTIVISGDHPTMDSDFCEDIDEAYQRKVYTAYVNADASAGSERREFSTFDNFPTTLAALGVDIEGNRLGLGTNLFSNEQTLTEIYGIEKENQELSKNSEFLDNLESVDENTEALKQRHTAKIEVGAYQVKNTSFVINVEDITGDSADILNVKAGVWTQEDQSDLQWIDLESDGEDYRAEINMNMFGLVPGTYHVHVYAETAHDEDTFFGEDTVEVYKAGAAR